MVAKGIEKGDNVEEEEEEEETGTVRHISSRRSLQEEGSDSFAKAFMRMFADLQEERSDSQLERVSNKMRSEATAN